jgi:hypothetical protein
MPRYFFCIRSADSEDHDEDGTVLPDDAAALDHACRIVRELIASGGYDDPRMVVRVQKRKTADGTLNTFSCRLRLRLVLVRRTDLEVFGPRAAGIWGS